MMLTYTICLMIWQSTIDKPGGGGGGGNARTAQQLHSVLLPRFTAPPTRTDSPWQVVAVLVLWFQWKIMVVFMSFCYIAFIGMISGTSPVPSPTTSPTRTSPVSSLTTSPTHTSVSFSTTNPTHTSPVSSTSLWPVLFAPLAVILLVLLIVAIVYCKRRRRTLIFKPGASKELPGDTKTEKVYEGWFCSLWDNDCITCQFKYEL